MHAIVMNPSTWLLQHAIHYGDEYFADLDYIGQYHL